MSIKIEENLLFPPMICLSGLVATFINLPASMLELIWVSDKLLHLYWTRWAHASVVGFERNSSVVGFKRNFYSFPDFFAGYAL